MFTGGFLQPMAKNFKSPSLDLVGRGLAKSGSILFSPISSTIGTAFLPVTLPLTYCGINYGLKHPKMAEELKKAGLEGLSNPVVRHSLAATTMSQLLLRTPVAAVVGFGAPLLWQKYKNSQNA